MKSAIAIQGLKIWLPKAKSTSLVLLAWGHLPRKSAPSPRSHPEMSALHTTCSKKSYFVDQKEKVGEQW
jgi:hypothetical protein